MIEKRVFLPHMQNTVHLSYELLSGADRVELSLRPSVNFRAQESPVSEPLGWPYEFRAVAGQFEICLTGSPVPPLRIQSDREGRRVHAREPADRQRAVSGGREPRLPGARRPVEPGLLRADARREPAGDARGVDRDGRDDEHHAIRRAAGRGARPPAAPAGAGRAGARRTASPRSWCSPPISSSSRRRAAPKSPRARTPTATKCAR